MKERKASKTIVDVEDEEDRSTEEDQKTEEETKTDEEDKETRKEKRKRNGKVKVRVKENRSAHTEESFRGCYPQHVTDYRGLTEKIRETLKESQKCSGPCLGEIIERRIPMVRVLRNYRIREDLVNDIIAGFTTAIMQIPQGMSYAMLADLDPIYGLYMSVFPVFIYSFLGTSPHISLGCYSIQCMMLSGVALKHGLDPLVTATTCALWAGIYLLTMGVFRLSSVMVVFSSKLVSGFTWGAAIHVLTGQLPSFFGIQLSPISGIFTLARKFIEIFSRITEVNVATLVVASITALILILNNELLKPWWAKKTRYPLPMELILVVAGTAVSYGMNLTDKYGISIVGDIPTGLPSPVLPRFEYLGDLAADALIVTLVGFAGTFSLAKLFASKKGTNLDPQQECYAIGLANLFGSFFTCGPASSAMSRSQIQVNAGARTTLTALLSCVFLLSVLLFFGPLLQTLPKCVLSAIIIVSLKSMFLLCQDFLDAWRSSYTDALMWLAPCLSAIILNIEYGLYFGVGAAVLVLLYRVQTPSIDVLGKLPKTQVYVDIKQYPEAEELPGVKIFRFFGGMYFSNRDYFQAQVMDLIKDAQKSAQQVKEDEVENQSVSHIILDLSPLNSIDMDGAKKLVSSIEELQKRRIHVSVVLGTGHLLKKISRLGMKCKLNPKSLFPTLQDAIALLESQNHNEEYEETHCLEPQSIKC